MSTTDRIEKTILLRAPRARVWRAISDAREFGEWFQVKLEGPFVVGAIVRGTVLHPAHTGLAIEFLIERVEPEHSLSFRWYPYAVGARDRLLREPTTLVEFSLTDEAGGTRLTVVESGFDRLPAARREETFRIHEGGWSEQVKNLERHVARA